MPFKSQAQRRWMHATYPKMATRWEKHTKKKKLPKYVRNARRRNLDPSRTTLLRRAFMADMSRRFRSINQDIRTLLVDLDVFGELGGGLFLNYDPDQPRDDWGRWTDTGGGGGESAFSDRNQEVETSSLPLARGANWRDLQDTEYRNFLRGRAAKGEAIEVAPQLDRLEAYASSRDFELRKEQTVYFGFPDEKFAKMEVGDSFEALGARSTTWDSDRAKNYAGTSGAVFEVALPEGTHAIHAKVFDTPELVLLPGAKFEVTAKTDGVTKLKLVSDGSIYVKGLAKFQRELQELSKKGIVTHAGPLAALRAQQAGEQRQAWRFQTSDQKLKSFQKWFEGKVQEKVFTVDVKGRPWVAKYTDSAYKKGLIRGYLSSGKAELKEKMDILSTSREQFLKQAFLAPERTSKAELLATRTYEELKGVTGTMSQQMGRTLSEGIIRGDSPIQMARDLVRKVEGLTRTRALTIARTEVIHAHAEGQLDSLEDLGVEDVTAEVEWSTAGDGDVCELCEELEGLVLSLDEARGLLPRHPNCRCAWTPAGVGESTEGQMRGKQATKAVKATIKAERPGQGLKRAVAGSTWLGKELL